jgi:23S rRNA (uracil1939-C5)-methyltransferase
MKKKFTPLLLPLHLEDAASDGRAVGRHEGQVVFVEGGVPGDEAEVYVFGKEKKLLNGRVEKLIVPSPRRTAPVCDHFGVCGGCKWQMMGYESQLYFKEKQVRDAFDRIAKVPVGEFRPILGSPEPYYYRNKLEFTFSNKAWLTREEMDSGAVLEHRVGGFHRPGAFDKILNIDTCHLQRPVINDIRNFIRDTAREWDWTFYDIKQRHGFLRNVMFRTSEATGELMVTLIVGEDKPDYISRMFDLLLSRFPEITDLIWIFNPKLNSSFSDLEANVWSGKHYITEKLGDFQFRIHPTSFFQTNPRQAANLYGVVNQYLKAGLPPGKAAYDLVFDLYSGTGSIGIFNSALANQVVGIEYVEAAVKDARENAALNGLAQFEFFAGDMRKLLPEVAANRARPDMVITDPPRAGMDQKVVEALLDLAPEQIIYVSCQPATQARDIEWLSAKYKVVSMQPVDMFPQTAHVENVAWLRRNDLF